MDLTMIIGLAFAAWLIYVFVKEMLPSEEQKAYNKAKKFPLECAECKQAKTYLDVSGGRYSDYQKGIVTLCSERVPTYCYMTKRKINNRNQRCIIPMSENEEINNAFIKDNIIEYQPPSSKEVGSETVFISLSGRKYHTAECTQIKGKKYITSLNNALLKGYSPCSKCKPPQ